MSRLRPVRNGRLEPRLTAMPIAAMTMTASPSVVIVVSHHSLLGTLGEHELVRNSSPVSALRDAVVQRCLYSPVFNCAQLCTSRWGTSFVLREQSRDIRGSLVGNAP